MIDLKQHTISILQKKENKLNLGKFGIFRNLENSKKHSIKYRKLREE